MKKILSTILVVVLILSVCPLGLFNITASAATSGYYTYSIRNGEAVITDVNTSISGSITIPKTLGGYSVTTIDVGAFENCTNITSISTNDTVKVLKENAFLGCTGITSVTIGAGVKSISPSAFLGCISIARLNVNSSNEAYYSLDNCIIETETLTLVLGCKTSIIPTEGEVVAIGANAFAFVSGIYSITIPNSVIKIGNSAFMESSITNIDLGISVAIIEDYAFAGCTRLEDIIIYDSIKFIGAGAFSGCEELYYYSYQNCIYLGNDKNKYLVLMDVTNNSYSSYTLGSGVKCIYDEAMSECVNLRSFTLPSSVTSIGAFAFANCSSLTNLSIPNSVESVGASAFLGCDKLVYNTYNNGKYLGNSSNKYVVFIQPTSTSISEITFANSVKCIYSKAFFGCKNLASISIPNTVSIIGEGAFEDCTNLKSISLGNNVKRVEGFAFKGCRNLTTIRFTNSVLEIGGYAFYECPSLKMVNFMASEQAKNKILIAIGNGDLSNAIWNYIEYGEYSGTITNPVKPIVIGYNSNSIRLYPFEGYEFSMDGVNWQTANTFEDLEDNTTYTLYQRIKTPTGNATASSVVATTAVFPWDTVKEFEYLQAVINRDYNYYDSDGDPELSINMDLGDEVVGYFSLINKGSYIRFRIVGRTLESNYLGTITDVDLRKNTSTLNVSHFLAYYVNDSLYDSAYKEATLQRHNYEKGDTYNFYQSGSYVITSQYFCDIFNANLTNLMLRVDNYLYQNYDSGLELLGFTSYDGYGTKICDPITGYHAGYREVRGAYDAGCVLDGYTGNVYCSACDQWLQNGTVVYSKGYHDYNNDCDATCNDCGEFRNISHTYSSLCDVSCNICGITRVTSVSHTYDNSCDATCNVCGKTRSISHTYDSACDTNCNVCGAIRTTSASHIYDNSCDTTCNACGKIRGISHTYDSSCDTSCNVCGAIRTTSASHIYDNSCDATCNACGKIRGISHTYDSSCDTYCNVCGLIRTTTATHIYNNSCDTTCNKCGEVRSISHTYDSLCDASCNVCGETRITSASHIYSNSCDATCDYCGDMRTDLVHTYDNECDNKCNDCDYERKAPHVYDDKKDLICNGCGYERPPYTPGDIDDSGEITLDDVVCLAQIVAGWQGVNHNEAALDVNGDGNITLDDVVLLAQYVAGWAVTIK